MIFFLTALIIGGIWLVIYLIESSAQREDEERHKLFQKATEDCYKREKSCDTIFENLYEELFPDLSEPL